MLPYIGRRLLATIPVMAVVAVAVFMLLRLTTGDPAAIIAGDYATSQDVAAAAPSTDARRATLAIPLACACANARYLVGG